MFIGNFGGAFTVAVFMAIIFTTGFSEAPDAVGQRLGVIGEACTVGYAKAGMAGMLTLFVRGHVQLDGVHRRRRRDDIEHPFGQVMAMWMPILVFFYLGLGHSIVKMFLYPSGLLLGANFTWLDYIFWNELPTVTGNLLGGLTFVGEMIYPTHDRTSPAQSVAYGSAGIEVSGARACSNNGGQ